DATVGEGPKVCHGAVDDYPLSRAWQSAKFGLEEEGADVSAVEAKPDNLGLVVDSRGLAQLPAGELWVENTSVVSQTIKILHAHGDVSRLPEERMPWIPVITGRCFQRFRIANDFAGIVNTQSSTIVAAQGPEIL